jgi:hypothetical protein
MSSHPAVYNLAFKTREKSGEFAIIAGPLFLGNSQSFVAPGAVFDYANPPYGLDTSGIDPYKVPHNHFNDEISFTEFTPIGSFQGTGKELYGKLWNDFSMPSPWRVTIDDLVTTQDATKTSAERQAAVDRINSMLDNYYVRMLVAVIDYRAAFTRK